jgi:FtsZ-binding cell division protein ZapB
VVTIGNGASTSISTGALIVAGGAGISGNVWVGGTTNSVSFNSTSDYRIKENVVTLDGTYTVDNIRPVTYINKKTQKQDIGVIAHELQEVYPFMVNGNKDDEEYQSVNYSALVPVLVNEIQGLKSQNKELAEKNKELVESVDELKSQNSILAEQNQKLFERLAALEAIILK